MNIQDFVDEDSCRYFSGQKQKSIIGSNVKISYFNNFIYYFNGIEDSFSLNKYRCQFAPGTSPKNSCISSLGLEKSSMNYSDEFIKSTIETPFFGVSEYKAQIFLDQWNNIMRRIEDMPRFKIIEEKDLIERSIVKRDSGYYSLELQYDQFYLNSKSKNKNNIYPNEYLSFYSSNLTSFWFEHKDIQDKLIQAYDEALSKM